MLLSVAIEAWAKSAQLRISSEHSDEWNLSVRYAYRYGPPFPQIDIIEAVVIVWRARGKIIRSVLCSIVCKNCTQWTAHTYEQTNSSLDWVLSHWAHFTARTFIFVYVVILCDSTLHACVLCSIVTWWGRPGGIEAWSLGPLLTSFSALTLLVGSFDP